MRGWQRRYQLLWQSVAVACAIITLGIGVGWLWPRNADVSRHPVDILDADPVTTGIHEGHYIGRSLAALDSEPSIKSLAPEGMRVSLFPSFMSAVFVLDFKQGEGGRSAGGRFVRIPVSDRTGLWNRQPVSTSDFAVTNVQYIRLIGQVDALLLTPDPVLSKEKYICLDGTEVIVERVRHGRYRWASGNCEKGFREIAATLHAFLASRPSVSGLPGNTDWIDP